MVLILRYLILFSYDGSMFNGFQKQPNKRTVQEEVEKVLTMINGGKKVVITAAGRTDALVNALNQAAHFDFDKKIPLEKFKKAINTYLPSDIHVNKIMKVSCDFHARYLTKSKTYEYKINIGEYNPLLRSQVYQYGKPLDITKIADALKYFKGTHDFTTFTSSEDKRENKVRTIYDASVNQDDDIITISFTGNGFLKYQIRNMVGLLIEIGAGKKNPCVVKKTLDEKDRTKIGVTASACGLTLVKVEYDNYN